MLDPLKSENRKYFKALSKKRKRAFFVLTIENFILHSWKLFFWALLFCGLWMLSIPDFFGQSAKIITAIVFFLGALYFIKTEILLFKFPTTEDIDRTLEKQSQFQQGQISFLEDELANPKKHETRNLWNKAQEKILFSFKKLKNPKIRVILSRKDPYALRFIAILFFISGYLIAGNQWQSRILNGMLPINSSITSANKTSNNRPSLWITPPDYTQLPQIHISGSDGKIIDIAEGSKIRVRAHNIFGKYLPLYLNGNKMKYLEDGLYGFDGVIEQGENIKVTQSIIPRANWRYNLIKDQPPEIRSDISKDDDPLYKILDNYQISFPLVVKDDYSVKELRVTMDIDEMVESRPLGDKYTQTRLVMSQPNSEFKIAPIYDMTWHSWAGLPVTFTYEAIDHKRQIAKLDKIKLILPERKFEHPLAKSLISVRKRLAWNYDDSFKDLAQNLEVLLSAVDYFQGKYDAYLAVRSASSRLYYQNNAPKETRIEAAKEVIKLLWDAAIIIEEGDLALAMRDMRDAQRRLENAMRDPNASEDEISKLMDNLREKMAAYFNEMQREIQKRMANGEDLPQFSSNDVKQMISPNILSKLMQEIENALRSGDNQKAQDLMSKLQRMMELMDPSMAKQLPKDMQKMREGINELQELIEKQEAMLEQTKDKNLPMPSKAEQEALRYVLGELMLDVAQELDSIPENMGKAEQEMRLSENYLASKFEGYKSIPHQEKTIEHLKEAQNEFNKQFKARMQQMIGIGLSGSSGRYDPLGRPYAPDEDLNGDSPENEVHVPDEAQKKRVDQILKELRERSGDRSRSDEALEYFRRLLRQF